MDYGEIAAHIDEFLNENHPDGDFQKMQESGEEYILVPNTHQFKYQNEGYVDTGVYIPIGRHSMCVMRKS